MIYAVIDVGSNSIRLSVYKIEQKRYTRMYTKKCMAGLASYISEGKLSDAGIDRACEVLADYRTLLQSYAINHVAVFATASLRNVSNTAEAVSKIESSTGFSVEVLSDEDEAQYSFYGAQEDCASDRGILIDIGGGSTETVFFEDHQVKLTRSMPIGSLGLYEKYVSKWLPKTKEYAHIKEQISLTMSKAEVSKYPQCEDIYGVGGTARASIKMVNRVFSLGSGNRSVSISQLTELEGLLCEHDEAAHNLIIKTCPERVHIIVPGIMILNCIAQNVKAKQFTVSRYGVREGYLCKQIIANHL